MKDTPEYGTDPETGLSLGPNRADILTPEVWGDIALSEYLIDMIYLEELLGRKIEPDERLLIMSEYGGRIEPIIKLEDCESIENILRSVKEKYRLFLS